MNPIIHPRVTKRHAELSKEDILHAWRYSFYEAVRPDAENFPEYLWLGIDPGGRMVEMVGTPTTDGMLIYHANTPPSKRTIDEVRASLRRRHHG